jgi:tetratricopeptide (TPR) repeat protein
LKIYARAYNNRGIAYKVKGGYDRAIADYDMAVILVPKFALAYNNRGKPTERSASMTAPLRTTPKPSRSIRNLPWPTKPLK